MSDCGKSFSRCAQGLGLSLGGGGGGRDCDGGGLALLVGREEVSEDGDWEPLPGRREKNHSGLPGSRGWFLVKEVGPWIVGKLGVDKAGETFPA